MNRRWNFLLSLVHPKIAGSTGASSPDDQRHEKVTNSKRQMTSIRVMDPDFIYFQLRSRLFGLAVDLGLGV